MLIKEIYSADFKRYNANSQGKRTGDCIKRAISLAFDVPYNEVTKLLNRKMRELRRDSWANTLVSKAVIDDLAGIPVADHYISSDSITVNQFADENPSGIYLIFCGDKPGSLDHLVCVRDGKVWDSWDSRKYYVISYIEVSSTDRKQIRNTDKYYMNDLANNYAKPIIEKEILKFMNKVGMHYNNWGVDYAVSDYSMIFTCEIILEKDDVITEDRDYLFRIPLVIEPTWTEPEIIKFIEKYAKQRTYDKMWTINDKEKKKREEALVRNEVGLSGLDPYYLTPVEKRFLNSIPVQIRPLIKDMRIQSPGKYPDSYIVVLKKHPNDHNHPDQKEFVLESWQSGEMKNMLEEYKNNFRIEGIDYNYEEEF